MAFVVKAHRPSFLLFFNCFRANLEQVFNNLPFNHMDALRKKIQSLIYFEPLFLEIRNVTQILTMINLFWKYYLVCSDINENYDTRQASFTLVCKVFSSQVIWGSLVSAIAYF